MGSGEENACVSCASTVWVCGVPAGAAWLLPVGHPVYPFHPTPQLCFLTHPSEALSSRSRITCHTEDATCLSKPRANNSPSNPSPPPLLLPRPPAPEERIR